jgi:hypothetical protein
VATSADKWNSNYDTVSANSAIWNKASATDRLSALDSLNSAYWEDASNIVCANSGKWNNYASSISSNSARIDAISSQFDKTIKPYFDTDTIVGETNDVRPASATDTARHHNRYAVVVQEAASNLDSALRGQRHLADDFIDGCLVGCRLVVQVDTFLIALLLMYESLVLGIDVRPRVRHGHAAWCYFARTYGVSGEAVGICFLCFKLSHKFSLVEVYR